MQPMSILRHLQQAVRTKKPNKSSSLHTALIEFKQACNAIPRKVLLLLHRHACTCITPLCPSKPVCWRPAWY